MNKNNSLSFEVIWKDDDMFELEIQANNSDFGGKTHVYEVSKNLLKFCNELKGFPNQKKTQLTYSNGDKGKMFFFEMRFYIIDNSGKIGVLIELERNTNGMNRAEAKDKTRLELIVYPAAIDIFHDQLLNLAMNEDGKAELQGN